jgi:hypothetical protein
MVKRADKLLIKLLIISSILYPSQYSFSQKIPYNDSVSLKREIDSVLKKHGLKSRGFAINVISLNQNGGQTAYSITNNYFSDPNYIPDEMNYLIKIEMKEGKRFLSMSPKYGTWTAPYILYDTTMGQRNVLRSGFSETLSFKMTFNGKLYDMTGMKSTSPCSPNEPMFINLNDKDNFIVFGDFSYVGRSYIYSNGKVVHTNIHIQ